MKKGYIMGIVIVFSLLVVTIVQIIVSNNLSTKGILLSGIDSSIDKYKKENMQLHEKILVLSSLTHIASVAASMGFLPEKDIVAINGAIPIAIK